MDLCLVQLFPEGAAPGGQATLICGKYRLGASPGCVSTTWHCWYVLVVNMDWMRTTLTLQSNSIYYENAKNREQQNQGDVVFGAA